MELIIGRQTYRQTDRQTYRWITERSSLQTRLASLGHPLVVGQLWSVSVWGVPCKRYIYEEFGLKKEKRVDSRQNPFAPLSAETVTHNNPSFLLTSVNLLYSSK